MKRILISVMTIALVSGVAFGATRAYFTDTEKSVGNTFTAGTIDISVDNMNPWNKAFTLADMKSGYTDYINFEIENTGSNPNPVNVWKNVKVTNETTGIESEPECTEQEGVWDNTAKACDWDGSGTMKIDNNDLSSAIWYDLSVEVYNANSEIIWWQTIYTDSDHKSIDGVYGTDGNSKVYLGMIPAGGKMKVKQSYHLADNIGNWAQGDQMAFDINLTAEQLKGTVQLENKGGPEPWELVLSDGIKGTLTYKVKNPTFDFDFTGKAPLANKKYYLVAGWKANGSGFDPDTELGYGVSGNDGTISFTGNKEIGKNLKDVKVWLVPETDWNGSTMTWASWPDVTGFLWETGLIWYEDTDL